MRVTSWACALFLFAGAASAQVLPPEEVRDSAMSELQKKYLAELKQTAVTILNHDFPYHFYFSRKLDLSEKDQHSSDQRSIQFDRYHDQTVLKITGNYFAAYSTELLQPEQRARQTYQDVILPLLEAAVPVFASTNVPEAFAFEISHHIRKKILGVTSEGVENVVLILPKASAVRLMTATTAEARQAAVSEGEAFLNASPVELWPGARQRTTQALPAQALPAQEAAGRVSSSVPVRSSAAASVASSVVPSAPSAVVNTTGSTVNLPAAVKPERDSSPNALKALQTTYQPILDRLVQDLNAQAHFVRYAPPAFIPFHNGLYLQLSVTTALPESAAGSQYKLAALAFDQHIAHLIRPALERFTEDHHNFDGIDFSTSIRLGDKDTTGSPEAVEFIFPLPMLQSYKQFDATGQQLIDSGFVLINGERVSLDLQIAEAASR